MLIGFPLCSDSGKYSIQKYFNILQRI